MINRIEYLEELISFKDKKLIKIITGIRRCGKSTLLDLYKNYLLKNDINDNQIISINFEDIDFENLLDYSKLHSYIKEKLIPNKMNYIFLDEIQNVPNFEKAVDSLYIKNNVDLYITGSNSYLLSSEHATLLSGRYVEIKMLPLSFKEYISTFPDKSDLSNKYKNYLINSSFPYALFLNQKKDIHTYLDGIFNSVILKDVVARKNISDVPNLTKLIKYLFDNIGNLCSTKKISDTMTSSGNKISTHTVDNYISGLINSFIFYKVSRYDIKGKQYLKSGDKYYAVDMGLRYYLLGSKNTDLGHILENIVYLELLRRGNEIYIGKIDENEVDFIAINEKGKSYYQVALTVRDNAILKRELKPLNIISDHNPKYLITLDDDPPVSHNGIQQLNALEWLLN